MTDSWWRRGALWLYRRSGQMFCFAAGFVTLLTDAKYGESGVAHVASAGVFFAAAIALKALAIWRFEK